MRPEPEIKADLQKLSEEINDALETMGRADGSFGRTALLAARPKLKERWEALMKESQELGLQQAGAEK
jgi:hypothetical protein